MTGERCGITWLGDGQEGCPPSIEWCGITFPIGKRVPVNDEWVLTKALTNPYFRVDNGTYHDQLTEQEAEQILQPVEPPKRKRGRPPNPKPRDDHAGK